MTVTVSHTTITALTGGSGTLVIAMQAIAIVLLLILLIERELLRASGRLRALLGGWILDVGSVPLLLAFVVIIGVRFVRLLQIG